MSRLLAIGDIHGQSAAFSALLNVIKPAREDVLVLLGDFINRGPDSRGVIERILGLREETQLICLRGNHEQMLLDALRSPEDCAFWLQCGGDETLRSFGCDDVESMPKHVFDFLNDTRLYHETEKFIFVHANVDSEVPMECQSTSTLLWRHLEYAPSHCSGKVIICGHTPQKAGLPVHFGSAVCIDTDVGKSGWLTCYEPLKNRFWQCQSTGKRRADILLPEKD